MKPISPDELCHEVDSTDLLISFINRRLKENPEKQTHEFEAVGIVKNEIGWEEKANKVLKMYELVGWKISDSFMFFSFHTRVEFKLRRP